MGTLELCGGGYNSFRKACRTGDDDAVGAHVIMFGGIALLLAAPLYENSIWYCRAPSTTAIEPSMPVFISLLVLGAALYVLVVRGDEPLWATSAVSTIVGYWLRASTYN